MRMQILALIIASTRVTAIHASTAAWITRNLRVILMPFQKLQREIARDGAQTATTAMVLAVRVAMNNVRLKLDVLQSIPLMFGLRHSPRQMYSRQILDANILVMRTMSARSQTQHFIAMNLCFAIADLRKIEG